MVACTTSSVGTAPDGEGTGGRATSGADGGAAAPATVPTGNATTAATPPAVAGFDEADGGDVVRLELGTDLGAAVDAAPRGSTFVLAAGVHRLQTITLRDGDRLVGEPGAVLSGARVLDAGDFTARDGAWVVGGQDQEGFVGAPEMLPGREIEARPEELFADGRRLRRVAERADLAPGTWWFDLAADEIWMGDDPARFEAVEASVVPVALRGPGTADVVVEDVTVRHYANPPQRGAIDGRDTARWTLRRVAVEDNHAAGIEVGPGMEVTRCRVARNGQIGITGTGGGDDAGRPIAIRSCEVADNHELGFIWFWEGGGIKVSSADGVVVANTWAHGQPGPGIWFDQGVTDAVVCSNLVEDNRMGVFVELSSDVEVVGNELRSNRRQASGDESSAVYVSESQRVEVHRNLAVDHLLGVRARQVIRLDTVQESRLADLDVHDNDLAYDSWSGVQIVNGGVEDYLEGGHRFARNTYRARSERPFMRLFGVQDLDGWRASGHDLDGRVLPYGTDAELPAGAVPFEEVAYGPSAPVGPGAPAPAADDAPAAERCDEAAA